MSRLRQYNALAYEEKKEIGKEMREIKFRAFDKRKKLMSNFFRLFEGVFWPITHSAFNEDIEIMQFTGLKDKNGKEIYEGDIVKAQDVNRQIMKNVEGIVQYHGSGYFFAIWPLHTFDELEVIGNIYENPELMEKK